MVILISRHFKKIYTVSVENIPSYALHGTTLCTLCGDFSADIQSIHGFCFISHEGAIYVWANFEYLFC